jgi:membrane associated rhomboid family serine protease
VIPLYDDNPTSLRPYVTMGLIATCVLVFLWQIGLPVQEQNRVVYALGFIPALLLGDRLLPPEVALVPPEVSLLTSMFLHGGWMHVIGNMLYLWIFGNNVEDAMGHARFVGFYIVCGIAAAFAQGLADPVSEIPMVGASGAIGGVLGAYLLLHPRARVLVLLPLGFFFTTLRVPAFVVLGLWFVLQFVSAGMTPTDGGGVAYWAHIGGFVAGAALIPFVKHRRVPLFDRGATHATHWVERGRPRRTGPSPWRRGPTRGPWG